MKFNEIVEINSNQLFSGAVDLDWYLNNNEMSKKVAASYFFHGPKNHSANCYDGSKNLTDTITMSNQIIDDVSTLGSKMELAVAGYGAGKSHFSVMISNLLNSDKNTQEKIISNIEFIDSCKAKKIKEVIASDNRPVLILPINGMKNCNLTEEFIRVTKLALQKDNQSAAFLNKFDSKYESLAYIIENHKNPNFMMHIIEYCGCSSLEYFKDRMDNWDEPLYNSIISKLNNEGERIPIGSSSIVDLKEMISGIYKNNCGENNYYKSMLIIFDEFGKYMMFAAEQETIAGKGIMQSLFEGINTLQDYSITLLALSQLDLKEYQNTTLVNNENIENNKNRYVTRFNDAKRYYLSVNFESLVSNLIKVKQKSALPILNSFELKEKKTFFNEIFPSSRNYDIWSDIKVFEQYYLACWPLDSFTLWILVYLSSVNTLLQQRSSLNILKECFMNQNNLTVGKKFSIPAVDLFNSGLGLEFKNSENSLQSQSQITNDYYGILEKYNDRLTIDELKVLQAIVISSKISAVTTNISQARKLIHYLTFIEDSKVEHIINNLIQKYNMIQEGLHNLYEINSDAPSQKEYKKIFSQRLEVLKKNLVLKNKPEYSRAFINSEFFDAERNNLFKIVEPTFGFFNDIKTLEWRFEPELIVSINARVEIQKFINNRNWDDNSNLLTSNGTLLFVIINEPEDFEDLKNEIKSMIILKGQSLGHILPLMVVLLLDDKSMIANCSILYEVISRFSPDEQTKFGPYLIKDKKKCKTLIIETIENANKENIIISGLDNQPKKRIQIANLIFETLYPKIISFPMDGFQAIQNRGATEIINLLNIMIFKPTKENIGNKLTVIQKKHCLFLLDSKWGFFDGNGNVKKMCKIDSINDSFNKFDKILLNNNRISALNIFNTLCKPPYGLNSTGSLLLTFLFYFGREKNLRCDKNNDIFDIKSIKLTKSYLKSNCKFFNIKDLGELYFVKMVTDDQLWIDLLDKWGKTNKIKELIDYNNTSNHLLNDLNIQLPNKLNNKQYDCKKKSEKAINKLIKYNDVIRNYFPVIERKANTGEVLFLYKNFALFLSSIDKIMDNKDEWDSQQIEKIYNFISYYKNDYLKDKFDLWLAHNKLTVNSKIIHKNNREKYQNLLGYLKSIGMEKYSNKIKQELVFDDLYINHLDEYEKFLSEYFNEINPIRNDINPSSLVKLLICWRNLKVLNNQLDKINDFPENSLKIINKDFENEKREIEELKSIINDVIEKYRLNLVSVFDSISVTSISELDIIYSKVKDLQYFYLGTSDEIDINNLIKEIEFLRKLCESIKYTDDSDVLLKEEYEKDVVLVREKFIKPLLNCEDILKVFYIECQNKLKDKSLSFVNRIQEKYYKSSSLEQWVSISEEIKKKPAYIFQKDVDKLRLIDSDIKEKLNKEQEAYIISLIKALDEKEKNRLFDQLKINFNL